MKRDDFIMIEKIPTDRLRKKFCQETAKEARFYEKNGISESADSKVSSESNSLLPARSSVLKFAAPSSSSGRLTEPLKENLKSQNETSTRLMSERNLNISSRRMPSSGIIENTNRRRYFADRVPEIHLLGEVRGAEGYFSSETVSCSWSIDLGQTWISLAGSTSGQTQYCIAQYDGSLIWNHPLDLHLTAKTLNGWPRILLQLWKLDRYGRATVAGYGYCDTPCTPGVHESDVECWMPCGSFFEEIHSYFMGNPRDLKDSNYVFKEALSSRCQLVTKSAGTIKICITTLVRYFDDQNVDI